MNYEERATLCKNPVAKKLFQIMAHKQSNLALSLDVQFCDQLLELAEQLGSEICVLKTHIDILNDFTPHFIHTLRALADQHSFLLFEDRKFADIGAIVNNQYTQGIYKIADWADIITAHILPGPGIIQGLQAGAVKRQRGLMLVAEMSSEAHVLSADYAAHTVSMAQQFDEFVMGFVAQRRLTPDPQWIYMMPGIHLAENKDALGQRYCTPHQAIAQHKTDVIIVGRGIYHAKQPIIEAKKYREAGWKALTK